MCSMIYRKIGRDNDKVSAIGFGGGIGGHASSDTNYASLEKTIRKSIDMGVNFIDTAPVYGDGLSEIILGKTIHSCRDDIFLATKLSPQDTTFKGVIESLEKSLKRLKTDRVDLLQVHWSNPNVPMAETISAMERLVEDGKVRNIGISNFSLTEMQQAIKVLNDNKLASVQSEYNLFERSAENNLLPFCERNDIIFISYSPLSQGKLVNGEHQRSLLKKIADRHGATSGQVVLRWLIQNTNVIVIPNTTKEKRAIENANACNISLASEDIDEISSQMVTTQTLIDTKSVRVSSDYNRKTYHTLSEAVENKLNMTPSPEELAYQIKSGEFLKPTRLKELKDSTEGKQYDLVEGRLRYWAWVIAYGWNKPIPSLVWRD